jgi:hypothetical protein
MGRNEKKKSGKLNNEFIIPGNMAISQDTRVRWSLAKVWWGCDGRCWSYL